MLAELRHQGREALDFVNDALAFSAFIDPGSVVFAIDGLSEVAVTNGLGPAREDSISEA